MLRKTLCEANMKGVLPMGKRVYKFTSAKHGISNLQNRRLKLSTIYDLNDPYDLCPLDTTDPEISQRLNNALNDFRNKKTGILCFSRNWDNLLLWSHYGDSHTGVCLGFDIIENISEENCDIDVLYQPNRLKILKPEDVNLDLARRLTCTKHECWSYEQEVRMFVAINDPPDSEGLNWIEFGSILILKEIIIGAQCHPKISKELEQAAHPYTDTVKCWWAGMRRDAFLLVRLEHPPDWHAEVK
jgi:hypothetical protein